MKLFRLLLPVLLFGLMLNGQAKKEAAAPAPAKKSAAVAAADQCQAKTKAGEQCKRKASAGSKFCWQHGGKKAAPAKKS